MLQSTSASALPQGGNPEAYQTFGQHMLWTISNDLGTATREDLF